MFKFEKKFELFDSRDTIWLLSKRGFFSKSEL